MGIDPEALPFDAMQALRQQGAMRGLVEQSKAAF
jgi:hypothetical protein